MTREHRPASEVEIARRRAGFRQADLAATVGVGRPLVSYIEHGYIPSAALRDRIAQALDTAEAELWPGLSDQVAA